MYGYIRQVPASKPRPRRRNPPPTEVNVTYERLPIRCGKQGCRCNTSDQKQWHGPYWYAFWTDPKTGKKRSHYVGKHFKPPEGPARQSHSERRAPPDRAPYEEPARTHARPPPPPPPKQPPPRPRSKFEIAAEILGVSLSASQMDARKAWRKLIVENHPDRFQGAERAEREKRAKEINAAWDTYRAARGWTTPNPARG